MNPKIIFLDAVREHNPLIHNITNLVSAHFTANGLLALGASPMMAESPDEMAELAAISGAVVLNLGTPSDEKVSAMLAAGIAANQAGVPVVLDPVAVGTSHLRQKTVATLTQNIQFSAIRGNAGELAYLADVQWTSKGVDVGQGSGNLAEIAQKVAQKFNTIAVLSGENDFVANNKQVIKLSNGVPLFPKVTATGCLLSAIVGAFLAVAPREFAFQAACEACTVYAVAGELAAIGLQATQSGTFAVRLLDALAKIDTTQVEQLMKAEWII